MFMVPDFAFANVSQGGAESRRAELYDNVVQYRLFFQIIGKGCRNYFSKWVCTGGSSSHSLRLSLVCSSSI